MNKKKLNKIESQHELLYKRINSFSKCITICWIIIWCETIVFSQLATTFGFGDAMAINYINDNVKEIGIIICSFYFAKSALENIAQGYENFRYEMINNKSNQSILGNDENVAVG